VRDLDVRDDTAAVGPLDPVAPALERVGGPSASRSTTPSARSSAAVRIVANTALRGGRLCLASVPSA
jgi:hypothetical protein